MCLFEALQNCENKNERWVLVSWLEGIAKEAAELRLECKSRGGHTWNQMKKPRDKYHQCIICKIAAQRIELADKRLMQ